MKTTKRSRHPSPSFGEPTEGRRFNLPAPSLWSAGAPTILLSLLAALAALRPQVASGPVIPPIVTIAKSDTNAVLSWTYSPSLNLQSTPSLSPPNWANAPGGPTVVGGRAYQTDVLGAASRFYRLGPYITPPCCPLSDVNYTQTPDLAHGIEVSVSPGDCDQPYGWFLADDFVCSSAGAITNIQIWGSWYSNRVDSSASFGLSIWSNVPTNSSTNFSHPGTLLWSQRYGSNTDTVCAYTNLHAPFENVYEDGPLCELPATNNYNLYQLCFTAFNPFIPTPGSNYWLVLRTGGNTALTFTNYYFGWSSSAAAYGGTAVVAQASYSLPVPTNGPWAPVNQGFYALPALNMAFRINQAATP